jgi:hypothetical protein
MNSESKALKRAEVVDEVSKWTVGLGIVVLALFPLSIPILVLTAVALVPLLVPVLALGIVAGVVAGPVLLVRRILRSRRRGRPSPPAAETGPTRGPLSQIDTAKLGRA